MTFSTSLIAILGMAIITLVSRSLFLMPDRDLPLPGWLREGLRYAPLAALIAVVAPEIFLTDGQLVNSLKDARLYGAAAGITSYVWKRNILATIALGTGTFLLLRFILNW